MTSASASACIRRLSSGDACCAGEEVDGPLQRVERRCRCRARRSGRRRGSATGTTRKVFLCVENPAQRRDVAPGDHARDGVLLQRQEPLAGHAHDAQRHAHARPRRRSASRGRVRSARPHMNAQVRREHREDADADRRSRAVTCARHFTGRNEQVAQERDDGDRQHDRRADGERLRVRQRLEQLALPGR